MTENFEDQIHRRIKKMNEIISNNKDVTEGFEEHNRKIKENRDRLFEMIERSQNNSMVTLNVIKSLNRSDEEMENSSKVFIIDNPKPLPNYLDLDNSHRKKAEKNEKLKEKFTDWVNDVHRKTSEIQCEYDRLMKIQIENEEMKLTIRKQEAMLKEAKREKEGMLECMKQWKRLIVEKDKILVRTLKREEIHVNKLRSKLALYQIDDERRTHAIDQLFKENMKLTGVKSFSILFYQTLADLDLERKIYEQVDKVEEREQHFLKTLSDYDPWKEIEHRFQKIHSKEERESDFENYKKSGLLSKETAKFLNSNRMFTLEALHKDEEIKVLKDYSIDTFLFIREKKKKIIESINRPKMEKKENSKERSIKDLTKELNSLKEVEDRKKEELLKSDIEFSQLEFSVKHVEEIMSKHEKELLKLREELEMKEVEQEEAEDDETLKQIRETHQNLKSTLGAVEKKKNLLEGMREINETKKGEMMFKKDNERQQLEEITKRKERIENEIKLKKKIKEEKEKNEKSFLRKKTPVTESIIDDNNEENSDLEEIKKVLVNSKKEDLEKDVYIQELFNLVEDCETPKTPTKKKENKTVKMSSTKRRMKKKKKFDLLKQMYNLRKKKQEQMLKVKDVDDMETDELIQELNDRLEKERKYLDELPAPEYSKEALEVFAGKGLIEFIQEKFKHCETQTEVSSIYEKKNKKVQARSIVRGVGIQASMGVDIESKKKPKARPTTPTIPLRRKKSYEIFREVDIDEGDLSSNEEIEIFEKKVNLGYGVSVQPLKINKVFRKSHSKRQFLSNSLSSTKNYEEIENNNETPIVKIDEIEKEDDTKEIPEFTKKKSFRRIEKKMDKETQSRQITPFSRKVRSSNELSASTPTPIKEINDNDSSVRKVRSSEMIPSLRDRKNSEIEYNEPYYDEELDLDLINRRIQVQPETVSCSTQYHKQIYSTDELIKDLYGDAENKDNENNKEKIKEMSESEKVLQETRSFLSRFPTPNKNINVETKDVGIQFSSKKQTIDKEDIVIDIEFEDEEGDLLEMPKFGNNYDDSFLKDFEGDEMKPEHFVFNDHKEKLGELENELKEMGNHFHSIKKKIKSRKEQIREQSTDEKSYTESDFEQEFDLNLNLKEIDKSVLNDLDQAINIIEDSRKDKKKLKRIQSIDQISAREIKIQSEYQKMKDLIENDLNSMDSGEEDKNSEKHDVCTNIPIKRKKKVDSTFKLMKAKKNVLKRVNSYDSLNSERKKKDLESKIKIVKHISKRVPQLDSESDDVDDDFDEEFEKLFNFQNKLKSEKELNDVLDDIKSKNTKKFTQKDFLNAKIQKKKEIERLRDMKKIKKTPTQVNNIQSDLKNMKKIKKYRKIKKVKKKIRGEKDEINQGDTLTEKKHNDIKTKSVSKKLKKNRKLDPNNKEGKKKRNRKPSKKKLKPLFKRKKKKKKTEKRKEEIIIVEGDDVLKSDEEYDYVTEEEYYVNENNQKIEPKKKKEEPKIMENNNNQDTTKPIVKRKRDEKRRTLFIKVDLEKMKKNNGKSGIVVRKEQEIEILDGGEKRKVIISIGGDDPIVEEPIPARDGFKKLEDNKRGIDTTKIQKKKFIKKRKRRRKSILTQKFLSNKLKGEFNRIFRTKTQIRSSSKRKKNVSKALTVRSAKSFTDVEFDENKKKTPKEDKKQFIPVNLTSGTKLINQPTEKEALSYKIENKQKKRHNYLEKLKRKIEREKKKKKTLRKNEKEEFTKNRFKDLMIFDATITHTDKNEEKSPSYDELTFENDENIEGDLMNSSDNISNKLVSRKLKKNPKKTKSISNHTSADHLTSDIQNDDVQEIDGEKEDSEEEEDKKLLEKEIQEVVKEVRVLESTQKQQHCVGIQCKMMDKSIFEKRIKYNKGVKHQAIQCKLLEIVKEVFIESKFEIPDNPDTENACIQTEPNTKTRSVQYDIRRFYIDNAVQAEDYTKTRFKFFETLPNKPIPIIVVHKEIGCQTNRIKKGTTFVNVKNSVCQTEKMSKSVSISTMTYPSKNIKIQTVDCVKTTASCQTEVKTKNKKLQAWFRGTTTGSQTDNGWVTNMYKLQLTQQQPTKKVVNSPQSPEKGGNYEKRLKKIIKRLEAEQLEKIRMMSELKIRFKKHNKLLNDNFSQQLEAKNSEINRMNKNIKRLEEELSKVKKISSQAIQRKTIEYQKMLSACKSKILGLEESSKINLRKKEGEFQSMKEKKENVFKKQLDVISSESSFKDKEIDHLRDKILKSYEKNDSMKKVFKVKEKNYEKDINDLKNKLISYKNEIVKLRKDIVLANQKYKKLKLQKNKPIPKLDFEKIREKNKFSGTGENLDVFKKEAFKSLENIEVVYGDKIMELKNKCVEKDKRIKKLQVDLKTLDDAFFDQKDHYENLIEEIQKNNSFRKKQYEKKKKEKQVAKKKSNSNTLKRGGISNPKMFYKKKDNFKKSLKRGFLPDLKRLKDFHDFDSDMNEDRSKYSKSVNNIGWKRPSSSDFPSEMKKRDKIMQRGTYLKRDANIGNQSFYKMKKTELENAKINYDLKLNEGLIEKNGKSNFKKKRLYGMKLEL